MSGFDFSNAVVLVNVKKSTPDTVVFENDIVFVRLLPAALSAMAIFTIVAAVVAIGVGIGAGIYLNEQQKKLDAELEKLKKQSNNDEIDNRPFLRGASNSVAKGKSQPYICGRHIFTPYLLGQPCYKISGTDGVEQFFYAVLECGFNKQIFETIKTDDVVIKDFTDTTPQNGTYDFNRDSIFFDENSKIEIVQNGGNFTTLPELNKKVVSETANKQIPYANDIADGKKTPLRFTLSQFSKSVDVAITFNNGLFEYNSDNDKVSTSIEIIPEFSLDNGVSWTAFTFDQNGKQSNKFSRNAQREIRFTAHYDFSFAQVSALEKPVLIQVRTTENKDSKKTNVCYVLFIQSVCYDPNSSKTELIDCKIVEDRERSFCTMLGIKIRATDANEDKLNKINIITNMTARIWDGLQWSETRCATRNPAAVLLEILTSPTHSASRFLDDEIDLDSFGELYEYCTEKNYQFDKVITNGATKKDTINQIITSCDAVFYRTILGQYAVAIDTYKTGAIAVFNAQNIISIENKKDFKRRTDGLRVKYINSSAGFVEDAFLIMRKNTELTQDSIIRTISLEGITEYKHAAKYALRLMAAEILRPKTTTIHIGEEGVFFTPLSKILLQDDSLKIGLSSGTIKKVNSKDCFITGFILYDPVNFLPNHEYGMTVSCISKITNGILSFKVIGSGFTKEVELLEPIRDDVQIIPQDGNLFSFGLLNEAGGFDKITSPYLIIGTSKTDNGYTLELADYNEAVYSINEAEDIPDYISNITAPPSNSNNKIEDTVTQEQLDEAVGKVKPTGVIIQYSVDGLADWHTTYNDSDYYMRQSINNGKSWSDAIRMTGQKGEAGATIKLPDISRCVLFISCDDVVGTYAINNAKKDSVALISGGMQVSGLSGLAIKLAENEAVEYKALPPLQNMTLSVFFKLDSYGVITQQCAKSLLIKAENNALTIYPDPSGFQVITKTIELNCWYCVIYTYDNLQQKEWVRLYKFKTDAAGRNSINTNFTWQFDALRDFETAWDATIESDDYSASGTIDAVRIDAYCWDSEECDGWAYVKGVTTRLFTAADYNDANIKEIVNDSTPRYLGALTADPVTYGKIGDWYAYAGAGTSERKRGLCYKKVSSTMWVIDIDFAHSMQAMNDLLQIGGETPDLPAVQFCNTLVATNALVDRLTANEAFVDKLTANEAFINKLAAKTITLQEGGVIQSEDYDTSQSGFRLHSQGLLEAKKVIVDEGVFNNGIFTNIAIKGTSSFEGEINSGPLILNQKQAPGASYSFIRVKLGAIINAMKPLYFPTTNTSAVIPVHSGKYTVYYDSGAFFGEFLFKAIQFDDRYPFVRMTRLDGYILNFNNGDSVEFSFLDQNSKTLKLLNLPDFPPTRKRICVER